MRYDRGRAAQATWWRGSVPWWRELGLAAAIYASYDVIHGLVQGDRATAVRNGSTLFHIEQLLHVDPEPWLNHTLDSIPPIAIAACFFYATLHFVVTPAVLVWVYWKRPQGYGYARTTLALITLVALVGFWLFPTAPPRLIPHTGLRDTLSLFQSWGWWGGHVSVPAAVRPIENVYAAMPSLHVAWAAWCGATVFLLARDRVVRLLAVAYPVATGIVVMATANHYLLDVVGGVLLWLLAQLVVRALIRMRAGRALARERPRDAQAAEWST